MLMCLISLFDLFLNLQTGFFLFLFTRIEDATISFRGFLTFKTSALLSNDNNSGICGFWQPSLLTPFLHMGLIHKLRYSKLCPFAPFFFDVESLIIFNYFELNVPIGQCFSYILRSSQTYD